MKEQDSWAWCLSQLPAKVLFLSFFNIFINDLGEEVKEVHIKFNSETSLDVWLNFKIIFPGERK